MTSLPSLLAVTLAVATTGFVLLWIVSLVRRDASIVDPCWGAGFVAVVWAAWILTDDKTGRGLLLAALTTIWGLRLSLYLWRRNRGHGEDRRYAAMRAKHGGNFAWVSLFTVFLLQAGLLWFISWPVQVAIQSASHKPFGSWDAVGVAVWGVGMFFETVGDWQLARFKARSDSSGRVLDTGLWRYTRHPNYFGDFCVWWGLYVVACQAGAYWTILSPVLMSFLLLKVSGVSLLESDIQARRPAYSDYIRRTSAFFPRPPRD
ncbi:MAG: DUF1295 domain-containing protein [Pirellulales bacterium]